MSIYFLFLGVMFIGFSIAGILDIVKTINQRALGRDSGRIWRERHGEDPAEMRLDQGQSSGTDLYGVE